MDVIDFAGMRGKGIGHTVSGAFKMAASFGRVRGFLATRKPDVVLGMGGYVTVPGGMMARMKGIPLALVNADAALLLSNKTLTPLAQRVLFGFPADFGKAAGKAVVTGNPVRKEILEMPAPARRFASRNGPLNILVVGGSLGAKVLNDAVPAALAMIPAGERPVVTHQSGKKNIDALRAAYKQAGVEANVVDFIDDMAAEYANADLVICRAGAITISELTAAGVASVLVPFVASTTSHQRDNAIWMDKQKAAVHLPQGELNAQRLANLLQSTSRDDCLRMAEAAMAVGRRDANDAIAGVLEQLARQGA
jgi:UDP-N-acetylglucosamine--N-acetylmuramyl-(pentapeptide) pyrophosphoryl-undecaprenol N-acetylglucosamine transferase